MFSYKKIKWIYYIIEWLITLINTELFFAGAVPLLAYILMVDLSLWFITTVYFIVVQKKEASMLGLMDECKMAEFIEIYSREHSKDTRKGFSASTVILLATAYMHLGDIETSMEMFQSTEPKNPQKARKRAVANAVVECGVYHNNISCAYLRCHDTENAKIHMEKAQDYLKQLQGIKDKKGKYNAAIGNLTRSLAIRELELGLELEAEPDYAEKINQLKNQIDGVVTNLNRVYYNCLLYVMYRKNGNLAEAEKCREYVRENGGDTCYVQWVEAGN